MQDESYYFLSPEEFDDIINKYNSLRSGEKKSVYFDVTELEGLLDFHLDQKSTEDVSELLKLADKQHPNTVGIELRRAKYYFSDGKYEDAWDIIKKLEFLEPSNHEVFLLKGLLQVMDNKLKAAKLSFQQVENLAEDELDEVYYTIAIALESVRHYKEAMRYYKKAFQFTDETDYDLLFDLAYCSEKAGYFDESIRYYHQYLDYDPFSYSAWYNLGVCYHSQEKYRQAEEAIDYSLTIDPDYILALHAKADLLFRMDKFEQAINYYTKVMNLSEEDAEGYCEIGECYRLMDMDEDALHNYQKALEIDENYADAIYGIGVLKYEKEAYLESISLLKQAIKISPYNPDYYYALAVSSMELDLIDEAEKAFEQAVKLYPYDPEFWLSYADLEFEKGNVKLALDLLKRGDHVNEKSARLKYRLAAYLLSKNDKKAGLTYFNDAFVIDKSEMDVFFNYFPEGKYLKEISKIISAQD